MATDYSALLRRFDLTDTEITYMEWAREWGLSEGDITRLFQESRFSSYARLMNCFIREYGKDVAMTYERGSIVLGNPALLCVPILRTLPLRTHIFADYPHRREQDEQLTAPRSIVRMLAAFDTDTKSNWSQLEEEYVLSCSQLFLAYLLRAKQAKTVGPDYLSRTSYQDADRALVFFEQWCAEGHLLHPTPKAKVGIIPEDLVRYMPEATSPIPLTWIALHRKNLVCSSPDAYDNFMHHTHVYPKLLQILNQKVGSTDDYYLMPVHPWQLENVIRPNLIQNSYIELDVETNADALIAFRTLYCEDLLAYTKLPVTVKITSGVRALSPRACRIGPHLSNVLARYGIEHTPALRFRFQREILSLYLDSEINGGNVSVVYRERLEGFIPEGCLPLPLAALFEPSPNIPERLVLDDLAELQVGGYLGLYAEYLEATMLPYIELLVRYGIGIEGHLQNTIVCFKDGHLSLVVLRDPDAVSICAPRFESTLGRAEWLEGWTVTDTMDDVYEKLIHSYLHSSIAELVSAISIATGTPVQDLWHTARKSIEQALNTLLKAGVPDVQIEEVRVRLLNPNAKLKSLLKMKLQDKTKEYIFASCANPLMRPLDPNTITHIVCDFSDVLVGGLEGSEKSLATHLGISETDARALLFEEDYTPLWLGEISEPEFMARIIAKDQRLTVSDLQKIVRANFKRIDKTWDIFKTLAKKRTLIMLSVNCREWVEYLDMHDELEIIFGPRIHYSYELGTTKRTALTFEYILKVYNLTPQQLLFIDDSHKNIAVAEALGIASIRFETPEQLLTDLQKTHIIKV